MSEQVNKVEKTYESTEDAYSEDVGGSGSKLFYKFPVGKTTRVRIFGLPVKYKKKGWGESEGKEQTRFAWPMIVYTLSDDLKRIESRDVRIWDGSIPVYLQVQNFAADPDWGDPTEYDIKVTRQGEGVKTKYLLMTCPKRPLSNDDKAAITEANLDVEAVLNRVVAEPEHVGDDPFADE